MGFEESDPRAIYGTAFSGATQRANDAAIARYFADLGQRIASEMDCLQD